MLYNMDFPDNASSGKNTSNEDIICDILIVIFIVIFAYYILTDKFEAFSSLNSTPKLVNTNPEQIKKQVSFNLNKNEAPLDEDDLLFNDQDILTSSPENIPELSYKFKSKSKKLSNPFDSNLTGADKSLMLMNENAQKSKKNYNCNLLGLNSDDINNFKKDYYGMYAHQIECPKDSYVNKSGTKKCGLDSDKDCNGVFTTDYNNSDVFALSYMSLLNNDKKFY